MPYVYKYGYAGERLRVPSRQAPAATALRPFSIHSMSPAHVSHGFADKLLQHIHVDISQFVDVKAGPANLVLAEARQQIVKTLETGHDVQRERLFARRETRREPIALAAALS